MRADGQTFHVTHLVGVVSYGAEIHAGFEKMSP